MIIDDFKRDEDNNVIAICGKKEVPLSSEYIAINKPQVGDEIVKEEPVAKASAPAEVEVAAPVEQ
jgi:hypothetical protein